MIRIAIAGAGGKMGKALLQEALHTPGLKLTAALERPGHPEVGKDVGALLCLPDTGIAVGDDPGAALEAFDVLIDFTRPEATLDYVEICRAAGKAMVIGTTGFSEPQRERIKEAASAIPMVFSPNMSMGVNLCYRLIEMAARALGEGFDVEIIEAHHRHKEDAPSGTALRMGEVVAGAMGVKLEAHAVFSRQGFTGPRPPLAIGFSTVRAGDIVGEHTAMFAGTGERVEITHRASSRQAFARGAMRAADWVAGKSPGLFTMQDVLGLH